VKEPPESKEKNTKQAKKGSNKNEVLVCLYFKSKKGGINKQAVITKLNNVTCTLAFNILKLLISSDC
jgi:hypothetical protein